MSMDRLNLDTPPDIRALSEQWIECARLQVQGDRWTNPAGDLMPSVEQLEDLQFAIAADPQLRTVLGKAVNYLIGNQTEELTGAGLVARFWDEVYGVTE